MKKYIIYIGILARQENANSWSGLNHFELQWSYLKHALRLNSLIV